MAFLFASFLTKLFKFTEFIFEWFFVSHQTLCDIWRIQFMWEFEAVNFFHFLSHWIFIWEPWRFISNVCKFWLLSDQTEPHAKNYRKNIYECVKIVWFMAQHHSSDIQSFFLISLIFEYIQITVDSGWVEVLLKRW